MDFLKPWKWFSDDLKALLPDPKALNRYKVIAEKAKLLPSGTMSSLWVGVMEHVKSLYEAERMIFLLENTSPNQIPNVWSLNPKELWKLIGRYSHVLQWQDDIIKLMNLLNEWLQDTEKPTLKLAENLLRDWKKYKALSWNVIATEVSRLNTRLLPEAVLNLTWDSEIILTRTQNEIEAIGRQIDQFKANRTVWTKALKEEISLLEEFARKIPTLPGDEATKMLLATEKISIKSLAFLVGKFKDEAKLTIFLNDIAKWSEEITEAMLHNKLIGLWEKEAAKLFKRGSTFTEFAKTFVLEAKAIRAEMIASTVILDHIDDGVKILAKIFSKVR